MTLNCDCQLKQRGDITCAYPVLKELRHSAYGMENAANQEQFQHLQRHLGRGRAPKPIWVE